MYKSINLVWLTKAEMSNINAGEGSEVKMTPSGKPYASGQSFRNALRETLFRENPTGQKCVPEAPCGNITECWLCDMFGYLIPSVQEKRWSPIKVSPMLGQLKSEFIADMLVRASIIDKNADKDVAAVEKAKLKVDTLQREIEEMEDKNEPTTEKKEELKQAEEKLQKAKEKLANTKDSRIAYVQLIENIYKAGIDIDVNNIGVKLKPKVEKGKFVKWEKDQELKETEKKTRIAAFLKAVSNLSGFAKQARNAVSLSPDILLISMQDVYNQRLHKALSFDEGGNIPLDTLETVLQDMKDIESTLFFGYTAGIINKENEKELFELTKKFRIETMNPTKAIASAIAKV